MFNRKAMKKIEKTFFFPWTFWEQLRLNFFFFTPVVMNLFPLTETKSNYVCCNFETTLVWKPVVHRHTIAKIWTFELFQKHELNFIKCMGNTFGAHWLECIHSVESLLLIYPQIEGNSITHQQQLLNASSNMLISLPTPVFTIRALRSYFSPHIHTSKHTFENERERERGTRAIPIYRGRI